MKKLNMKLKQIIQLTKKKIITKISKTIQQKLTMKTTILIQMSQIIKTFIKDERSIKAKTKTKTLKISK